MEIREFLAHFTHVKQESPSMWRGDCPACGDTKRHLYITHAPDKFLLDCKKGCEFKDIISAAGLKPGDCFAEDNSPKKQPWQLLREHFYTDVSGNILGKKQIYDIGDGKKTGIWYRLEKGQYIKGLNNVKMPLYHLHKLVKSGNTAVIAEGEKDAETVERLGFAATTSPNGAGSKWRSDFNEFFRGKNVVIITDNDEAGEKYGREAAENVIKTAAAVKLIRSSDIYPGVKQKGDISDIAAELGDTETKQMLTEAVKNAEPFKPAKPEAALKVLTNTAVDEALLDTLARLHPESRFPANDRGNGELFAEVFKNKAKYCINAKEWYVFKDGYWQRDMGNMIIGGLAKDLYDALLLYASSLPDGSKTNYTDHINKMGRLNVRENMLKDARDRNFIKYTEFDCDKWLFNCRNGTYDLKNGYFRAHNPKDFISKMSNVTFDANAVSADFDKFLNEIMSYDGDKKKYLLSAFGYALTGDTSEECMFILHGKTTRNGKSTLAETVAYLMGDYYKSLNPDSLAVSKYKNGSQASPDIARLAGARFVNCSEPEKGMVLNCARIKNLTGGNTLNARNLNENNFEFIPELKLFFDTNWLPYINDNTVFDSHRINVIPFDRHFEDDEQDHTLKARLITPENISGIFNALLDGLEEYKRKGLRRPLAVSAATAEYTRSSDRQGMFISECLEADPNVNITAKTAYDVYLQWCRENNYHAENKSNFMAGLRAKKLIAERGTVGGCTYHNVICGYKIAEDYCGDGQTAMDGVPF